VVKTPNLGFAQVRSPHTVDIAGSNALLTQMCPAKLNILPGPFKVKRQNTQTLILKPRRSETCGSQRASGLAVRPLRRMGPVPTSA